MQVAPQCRLANNFLHPAHLQKWYSSQSLAEPPVDESDLGVAHEELPHSVQHECRLQRAGGNNIQMYILSWCYTVLVLYWYCLILHLCGLCPALPQLVQKTGLVEVVSAVVQLQHLRVLAVWQLLRAD
ncbi:hypothetical protein B484DRAFT_399303 [Ochromonadaceae sp. CCMP2298]|nr:hypothetical protein B484DRAFT_399303 [Ochromonadaceae sp. CCMP2298]